MAKLLKQEKPIIIAELGINHNGQVHIAKELIEQSAEAGIWGLKFQYRNLENAYAGKGHEIGDEILKQEIQANYLAPETIVDLANYTRSLGLRVGVSFFDPMDAADFATPLPEAFDFMKVPSPELMNDRLVDAMLGTGLDTFISTGCHTETQIDKALSRLPATAEWTPLHCISNYPVAFRNAKLGYISHMQKRWARPVGYSSHDAQWEACLLALQLGAAAIERHLTFDKAAKGVDHSTSSTPSEFARLQSMSEDLAEALLGNGPRHPNQGEMLNLQNLGRSYYAVRDIDAGAPVTADDLVLRAPKVGLGTDTFSVFAGSDAKVAVKKGDVISRSTFSGVARPSDESLEFARAHQLSLPIRLHDMRDIQKLFPIDNFEFHLSFGEVLGDAIADFDVTPGRYSVHLPDYVDSTTLMDPFSTTQSQREGSHLVLQKTAEFVHKLQDVTGESVPVVGSFSILHGALEDHYGRYAELLDGFRKTGVDILPQWLPPIAWYFGGSVKLDVMINLADIDLLEKYQLPVCLDYSHLFMGAAYFGFDAQQAADRLLPLARHIHIADAAGLDGEGVRFGEGDPRHTPILLDALDQGCAKVIEVWQGHLDHFAGFNEALQSIQELANAQSNPKSNGGGSGR